MGKFITPVISRRLSSVSGYHDDCFLANKLDQGTYMDGVEVDYPYVHEQTKYLVAGGETCEWSPTDPGRSLILLRGWNGFWGGGPWSCGYGGFLELMAITSLE